MSVNAAVTEKGNNKKKNRFGNTLLLLSLTQEVFVKAGFMQGGGGPLWGDRCTAAGLFWREQQGHI